MKATQPVLGDSAALVLSYYPRRAKRWVVGLSLTTFLLIVAVIIGTHGQRILWKASVLLVQARCLRYSDSASDPVYAERRDDFSSFQKRHPALKAINEPDVCRGGRVVSDWMWLRQRIAVGQAGLTSEGTIFVGKLKSASGTVRLVALDISRTYSHVPSLFVGGTVMRAPLAFEIDTIEPEGFLSYANCRPRFLREDGPEMAKIAELINYYRDGRRFQFYAGRVDPKDESCFRARVIISAHEGGLVGKLRDDGSVSLFFEGFVVPK